MGDKKRNKYNIPNKIDRILTKENAKAKYENLQENETDEEAAQFEDPVEQKIRKAMTDGEFDNLQGKGKPLDLGKYKEVPEHLRIAYHVLKNAGYVPEEVRLKKEMELIQGKIKQCRSKNEKEKLIQELADISQQFHFCMEYNKRFK
jgi:hypothetical protein